MTLHGQPDALKPSHANTSLSSAGETSDDLCCRVRQFTSEISGSGPDRRTFFVRDATTGLFNQSYLEEAIEREFARARLYDDPVSLMLLNIDYLQNFSDQCGAAAMNILLQVIAHLLKSHVRPTDITCCYGGGRYAALMHGAPSNVTRVRAEFLRGKVPSIRWCDNARLKLAVSLSAGIASFPEHAVNPASLFQAAETALRRAMNGESNRVTMAATRQDSIRAS